MWSGSRGSGTCICASLREPVVPRPTPAVPWEARLFPRRAACSIRFEPLRPVKGRDFFPLSLFSRSAAHPHNQWLCHGLPTLLDGAPHLRGFRFLYDCRGETVLVVPLDFGFSRAPGSVSKRGVGFIGSWPNGSLTPLLPGFRSVDIVSFPC